MSERVSNGYSTDRSGGRGWRVWVVAAFWGFLGGMGCWAAQEGTAITVDPDEGVLWADDWLADYLPEDRVEWVSAITESDWLEFWRRIQEVLQSESLDDLAWNLPEAEVALDYLGHLPGGMPYANWLRSRIDYLSSADEVVRRIPTVPPSALRSRPSSSTGIVVRVSIRPPALPPSLKVPPDIAEKRSGILRNMTYWKKKIAVRPDLPQAKNLIPQLKVIFVAEGVPPEWVWIAEVESSLDPHALSPMGAVGLFQFMPATAHRFGLRTEIPDERMEPGKSARAAAQYLRFLHAECGNWPLALAAYNGGEGRILRLLKQHSARTFDQIAPHLPPQTQMYVPRVMATVAVREKIDPTTLPPPKVSVTQLRNPLPEGEVPLPPPEQTLDPS
jgi:membrane-bound lytic murein transglycosylase D